MTILEIFEAIESKKQPLLETYGTGDIGYKLTKGFAKSMFLIGIVFCIGDVADRYYFDINTFHFNDLLLYLFAIYYLSKPLYAGKTETDT